MFTPKPFHAPLVVWPLMKAGRLGRIAGLPLVRGRGAGALLHANVPLSFWGGVDPDTGRVIDVKHPLHGECVTSSVLAIPNGRGSCTGSQVVLELLVRGAAPAAILLRESDDIISLGAIVAEEIFGIAPLPVVSLGPEGFDRARSGGYASVDEEGVVHLFEDDRDAARAGAMDMAAADPTMSESHPSVDADDSLELSADDEAMLRGDGGVAAQVALRVLLRTARLQGATRLVDVTQAHLDSCIYIGGAGLEFARKFAGWQGKVRVPTTTNAISVDLNQWRAHGVGATMGKSASDLADAYLSLGAQPSFTCAPYLLEGAPSLGEHIGWSESNAVVFANACLGARTQKYADFLDVCVALTGRAPFAGCHTDEGRRASLLLHLDTSGLELSKLDDAFYGALGYLCGLEAGNRVPLLSGLEGVEISRDQLKAFSAAFGTTGAAALFHIAGHTPEAHDALPTAGGSSEGFETRRISAAEIRHTYAALGGEEPAPYAPMDDKGEDGGAAVQLVALGNPHFSFDECAELAALIAGERRHDDVRLIVTMGRAVLAQAQSAGHAAQIDLFGGQIVSDTCWCMLREPVVPESAAALVTNSAKYAHYAPGLVDRRVRFASLEGCIAAAVHGRVPTGPPPWLRPAQASIHSTHVAQSMAQSLTAG